MKLIIDIYGIIPKNYNTNSPLKNTNATLDINKIIEINTNSYTDSAKNICVDNTKSTNANNNYSSFTQTFCVNIINKARYEIINEAIYANSIKSTCVDNIKTTNYMDIIKSTCNGTIKNKFTCADSAKSTYNDKIKSTIVKINYLDIPKSTYADLVNSESTKIIKQNRVYCNKINNKSVHSKINYEISALLKIKKVSNTNIIIKKKLDPQAINIKYELNALNKIKTVTNASKNVIDFLNKHIIQIINGIKVHMQNVINNAVANRVIHDNTKKAHAKLANSILLINKIYVESNTASNTSKKTHKNLFNNVLKQIKTFNKVHKPDNVFDYDKCKKLHKELFNKVLIKLLYTKSAGHKDSSANIKKAHANDVKHANSFFT